MGCCNGICKYTSKKSDGQSTKYGLVNFWTLLGGLGSSSSSGGGLGAHNSIDSRSSPGFDGLRSVSAIEIPSRGQSRVGIEAPDIANWEEEKVGTGLMALGVDNLVKEDDFIPVSRCPSPLLVVSDLGDQGGPLGEFVAVRCLWRVCQESFDVVARFRVKWKCMCSYSNGGVEHIWVIWNPFLYNFCLGVVEDQGLHVMGDFTAIHILVKTYGGSPNGNDMEEFDKAILEADLQEWR
ncbi:unnamed protein product, partial [Citrullus colocynthis]